MSGVLTNEPAWSGSHRTGDTKAFLDVRDLKIHFKTDDGVVKAVDEVTFSVERDKTLGIVGESGSGRSVTASGMLALHRRGSAQNPGEVWSEGEARVGA